MPPSADELSDLGVRQQAAGDRSAAAASYERAIAAHPGHAVAYNNLASLLSSSSRRAEALGLHLAAHRIAPSRFAEYPQMHLNLAGALVDAARYDEAVAHYGAGLRYEPSRDDTLGRMVHLMQRTCDWRGVGTAWPALRASLRRGRAGDAGQRPPLSPMHALTMPLDARDLLELSRAHAAAIAAAAAAAGLPAAAAAAAAAASSPPPPPALHVGFLSSDFKQHPVSTLFAPALEALRRRAPARLRLSVFALNDVAGDARGAPWWRRLAAAAHASHDLHSLDDAAAAAALGRARIDLLVDLNGLYSRGARPQLVAARAAPLQATHLGFGASTGAAAFVGLAVADRIALPPSAAIASAYDEKLLLLPPPHLPAGHDALFAQLRRGAPDACCTGAGGAPAHSAEAGRCRRDARAAAGLPPPPGARGGGVVYAYLGQHHKLSAAVVERWASLLRAAPRAVLWLLDWPGSAARLRAAVAAAGVRASRLVFAPRRPLGDHLCAFALADIALDSPLYNSGATGIDLLWAGVPLISIPGALADGGGGGESSGNGGSSCRRGASGDWRCVGTIFQRNALSLAAAARQPHTVAHTWRGYDALAGAPAARPATRRELRRRAREARRDAPLFDTDRWAANFEAGARIAWEAHTARAGPMHIVVAET